MASPANRTFSPGSPARSAVCLGSTVVIRGPDDIHHKLRDYAGTPAVIVDVPVHPNTWFGVRLFDGTTVKIR